MIALPQYGQKVAILELVIFPLFQSPGQLFQKLGISVMSCKSEVAVLQNCTKFVQNCTIKKMVHCISYNQSGEGVGWFNLTCTTLFDHPFVTLISGLHQTSVSELK